MIQQLPQHVVNQIAAGEVVERPASVVKELVENAIDAEADTITVSVVDGGKTRLKVTDNGHGIGSHDIDGVFQPHATSKMQEVEDLETLLSLGFRGEALATIASVSEISLETKTAKDTHGTRVELAGGQEQARHSHPLPSAGTQIEIRHLCYNTPARRKFLKKAHTKLKRITRLMEEMALAHPEVTFEVYSQDRNIASYTAGNTTDRVSQVLAQASSEWLVPVEYHAKSFEVSGFVSHPHWTRSNRQGFYVSVNGRPVQQQMVAQAVLKGYDTMLEKGQYPVFALNIQIDPSLIDVNIHPRKAEVRFSDERSIFSGVVKAVRSALEQHSFHNLSAVTESLAQQFEPPTRERSQTQDVFSHTSSMKSGDSEVFKNIPRASSRPQDQSLQSSSRAVESGIAEVREHATHYAPQREPSISGQPENHATQAWYSYLQIWQRYIVFATEKSFYLMDQHAAHEKLLLEEFTGRARHVRVQGLLTPYNVPVSLSEGQSLMSFLDASLWFGYKTQKGAIWLTHVPDVFVRKNLETLVSWMIERIEADPEQHPVEELTREIHKEMACKAAVKAGDTLSESEIQTLITDVLASTGGFTCCHGRPAIVQLTEKQLDTLFSRK